MPLLPLDMVLCTDERGQIGCTIAPADAARDVDAGHHLLYRLPADQGRFRSTTLGHHRPGEVSAVLIGRRTWESLKGQSLPGRVCVVLGGTPHDSSRQACVERVVQEVIASKTAETAPLHFHCIRTAYETLCATAGVGALYVIGGAQLWRSIAACSTLAPLLRRVHWTRVQERWGRQTEAPSEATVTAGEKATANSSETTAVTIATFDPITELFDENTWEDSVVERWDMRADGRVLRLEQQPQGACAARWEKCAVRVEMITLERPQWRDALGVANGGLAMGARDAWGPRALCGRAGAAELQYLALLSRLLTAPARATRNATTRSLFGARIVCDLADGRVPLLTTKKMAFRTVLRELLWFVRGETDNALLQAQGVKIWSANASRAFLDARGLTKRPEGQLGPVYGHQWRRFGAAYKGGSPADYATGDGVDQLQACVEQLRSSPHSRRMLFTAWNPVDLDQMALPPCHVLGQWYVRGDDALWLQVYQRSGDVFLGVPFNLFSYSALVHMMAHLTDLRPGGLVYVLGDAHLYETHEKVARAQLQRCPYPAPRLMLRAKDHATRAQTWEDFAEKDFDLQEYTCHPSLKCAMVA